MADRVLVTGAAGFIGSHVTLRLLTDGHHVTGIDNLDPYYDPNLKQARLGLFADHAHFTFCQQDIADAAATDAILADGRFDVVVHLAAQPGVRPGLTVPHRYVAPNLTGFLNVLEACRHHPPRHLVYASSSSVYGANRATPFSEHHPTEHPVSLYAATKKANEMMAHAYAHLFGLPVTGLRFFTVYGPWGRPDMAISIFADRIARGLPIEVANGGEVRRDFTYIDDVVDAVTAVLDKPPSGRPDWDATRPDPATSRAPYRVLNVGGDAPASLNQVIALLEEAFGRRAVRVDIPLPPGDVEETRAATDEIEAITGRSARVTLADGIARFAAWHRAFRAGEGARSPA